jgi:hypothetical protein
MIGNDLDFIKNGGFGQMMEESPRIEYNKRVKFSGTTTAAQVVNRGNRS